MQAFGVFTFIWQFVLHLTILVIVYGKILSVIRRQTKVMSTQCGTMTVASKDTVGGPRKAQTDTSTVGTTERNRNVRAGNGKAGTSSQNQGGQGSSAGLSQKS